MAENPKVTSKFDRMHGKPRVPGKVESPGQPAVGGAMSTTHSSMPGDTHKSTHYKPHEHGRMDEGGHADHPGVRRG